MSVLKESGIYIINSIIFPDRSYIGSAKNLNNRFYIHKYKLQKHTHENSKLQNHVDKYGLDDLTFNVVEICSFELLIPREQYYLNLYKPFFNIRTIAENNTGLHLSIEGRAKVSSKNKGKSAWNKGKSSSPETRLKLRIARLKQGNPFKGCHHSEESKEKNRQKHLGLKQSQETRDKKKGRPAWNKGCSLSQEHKNNLSKAWEKRRLIFIPNKGNFSKGIIPWNKGMGRKKRDKLNKSVA